VADEGNIQRDLLALEAGLKQLEAEYNMFFAGRLPRRPGAIVDGAGGVVGGHDGVARYTIGQRRGIGAFGAKRFVTGIDPELNRITIGEEDDLLARRLWADAPGWVAGAPPADEFEARGLAGAPSAAEWVGSV